MQYTCRYISPLGSILLAADGEGLTGLWFDGQKYFARGLDPVHTESSLPALDAAARWLDAYFSGREPAPAPPLHLSGTEFQRRVWNRLLEIPYGETISYGTLARELSSSPRAVAGAVGHNPISVIVPCHRVLGADGGLIGYAGGLERKNALLKLERAQK